MKIYHRPFPNTWWLKRRQYLLFMIRELTSVFVAGYSALLLVVIYKLSQGPEAFANVMAALASPGFIALQLVILVFALFHSITWLNLTPKILVVYMGEEKVSPLLIAGVHYLAWIAISIAIAWILLAVSL